MTGARPSLARGLNKSFAKSRGCYNASANFAPAGRRLKVSGAEASELDARCHSSPIYLFIQVCFRKKGKKTNHLSQTPLLPPLGLFPRHRPGGGGGEGVASLLAFLLCMTPGWLLCYFPEIRRVRGHHAFLTAQCPGLAL